MGTTRAAIARRLPELAHEAVPRRFDNRARGFAGLTAERDPRVFFLLRSIFNSSRTVSAAAPMIYASEIVDANLGERIDAEWAFETVD
jgi:hypothetical protein